MISVISEAPGKGSPSKYRPKTSITVIITSVDKNNTHEVINI